jgi:hypothetical protein
MNLTLGTLASLKTWLLPESERTGTEWDSAIATIGRGAAGALERHCNRKFARTVADTFECSADRAHVVLPRYPVEAVTKIEIRRSLTEGWVELTNVIENQNLAAGFLLFGSDLGLYGERVRFTYTAGYWLDEADDGSVNDDRTWQQGSVDLSVNDESKAVTFPSAFASAPAVNPIVVPPVGGIIIAAVPQSILETGFTAVLGFPIPAAGYKLQWTALLSTAAAPTTGDLPEGATAVPADLQLAWMQQCAHLWRQKDKLGSALASNSGEAAVSQYALDDSVAESVFTYRRLSLI